LIVPVVAKFAVEIGVFRQLLAIQPNSEPWSVGNTNGALLVLKFSAFDDVVDEMVVVRVGSEREVRNDCSEMKHGSELNAQLTRRVDRDTQLKRVAHAGRFHAGANAAPERCVEKNDVDRWL